MIQFGDYLMDDFLFCVRTEEVWVCKGIGPYGLQDFEPDEIVGRCCTALGQGVGRATAGEGRGTR